MFDADSEKRTLKAQREAFADENARLTGILGAMQAELIKTQAELKAANEKLAEADKAVTEAEDAERHKAE